MLDACRVPANSSARSTASRIEQGSLRLGGNQNLPVAVRLHGRNHAGSFHILDQARRAVIADAQVALHQRDGGPSGAQNDLDRLVVKGIFLAGGLPLPRARPSPFPRPPPHHPPHPSCPTPPPHF